METLILKKTTCFLGWDEVISLVAQKSVYLAKLKWKHFFSSLEWHDQQQDVITGGNEEEEEERKWWDVDSMACFF